MPRPRSNKNGKGETENAPKINLVKDGEVKMTTEVQEVKTAEPAKGVSRGHYNAVTVYGLTAEIIAAAIADGRIANVGNTEVVIRATAKSGSAKDEFVTYEKLIALNFAGQMLLAGGKEEPATDAPESGKDERTDAQKAKGACDHFNYGFDLEIKRDRRSKLAELIEGPAKAIAKGAQSLLDNGMADTLDEAINMVKASRAKKGLPV